MTAVLITCEHGGNRVPAQYAGLFRTARRVLATHRGYDLGSWELSRHLAQQTGAVWFGSRVTRLLVDLNRSPRHRRLFSEFSRTLPAERRQALVARYYDPYRRGVEQYVRTATGNGQRVIHVSVHTFVPRFNGIQRRTDVGFLYDPRRRREAAFCAAWRAALHSRRPQLRLRRNHPYLGKSDGLTTHLRKLFSAPWYVGIELEVSQAWPSLGRSTWNRLQHDLAASLRAALAAPPATDRRNAGLAP